MENLLFYATKKSQEKTSLYMSDENHKKYLEEIEYNTSFAQAYKIPEMA